MIEMPRQRMVKPEFFESDTLAECSIAARLLFIGLWVMSDDKGNCKMNVRKLKRQVFPYDGMSDDEFAEYLIQLEAESCIKGYEVDGERYINVPNFSIYQTVNRPSKSTIPEPPKAIEKVKRTTAIKEWLSAHTQLTDGEYSVSAHPKERNKEGSCCLTTTTSNSGSVGAEAGEPAPPSPPDDSKVPCCPLCSAPVKFDPVSFKWRCKLCGEIKAPEYREAVA